MIKTYLTTQQLSNQLSLSSLSTPLPFFLFFYDFVLCFPCLFCHKSCKSNQKSIFCDICEQWAHFKCRLLISHTMNLCLLQGTRLYGVITLVQPVLLRPFLALPILLLAHFGADLFGTNFTKKFFFSFAFFLIFNFFNL